MQMKINFNKLFSLDDSNQNTQSTTSLEQSYVVDQPSIYLQSHHNSQRIDYHYKFNEAVFDNSIIHHRNDSAILKDLQSFDRSLDNSLEKQKPKKYNKSSEFIHPFLKPTDSRQACPGHRLYNLSQITKQRKEKQLQRLKDQIMQEQIKNLTFKPEMSKKSKQILDEASSPIRKVLQQKKLKQKEVIVPSFQKKEQQQLKQCTFKPQINVRSVKQSKTTIVSQSLASSTYRSGGNKFDKLYYDHKMRQMRKKLTQEQQKTSKATKKLTKQQLEQFFHRNQQYMHQKQQKQQLLKSVSSEYDLSSGRKLFSPTVQNKSKMLLKNSSSKHISQSASSKNIGGYDTIRSNKQSQPVKSTKKKPSHKPAVSKSSIQKTGTSNKGRLGYIDKVDPREEEDVVHYNSGKLFNKHQHIENDQERDNDNQDYQEEQEHQKQDSEELYYLNHNPTNSDQQQRGISSPPQFSGLHFSTADQNQLQLLNIKTSSSRKNIEEIVEESEGEDQQDSKQDFRNINFNQQTQTKFVDTIQADHQINHFSPNLNSQHFSKQLSDIHANQVQQSQIQPVYTHQQEIDEQFQQNKQQQQNRQTKLQSNSVQPSYEHFQSQLAQHQFIQAYQSPIRKFNEDYQEQQVSIPESLKFYSADVQPNSSQFQSTQQTFQTNNHNLPVNSLLVNEQPKQEPILPPPVQTKPKSLNIASLIKAKKRQTNQNNQH